MRSRTALFSVLLLICAGGVAYHHFHRSHSQTTSTEAKLPVSLTPLLARTLGKDDPAYHIAEKQGILTADNAKHGYSAQFTTQGAVFSSGFTLSVPNAQYTSPDIQDNVVTYQHDTYQEWYVNSPLGVEQGFTLTKQTTIEVSIQNAKSISLHPDKRGVDISTNSTTLSYQGLTAFDATGKELAATFTQTSPTTLAIHVDDSHAKYPITIDPYVQEQKLALGEGGVSADHFGMSTAIDSTGTRMVVGGGLNTKGAAYVFLHSGTSWTLEQKLTADDGMYGDGFGSSVAIDSTGTRVLVGAQAANVARGAAYIYSRLGTAWAQEQKLTASDGVASDFFGYSVAMDSTGTRVAIGADQATINGHLLQGAAYVFVRVTSWTQEQKLTASDGAAENFFGQSIAIDSSGLRIVIGADYATVGANAHQGAAYVFVRTTTWAQEQKLTASDGAASDQFGFSVAMDGTGARVVVGAMMSTIDGKYSQGAAYTFSRDITWTQEQKLTVNDGVALDQFGVSVAIAGDDGRIIVGAGGVNSRQGAIYVFSHDITWAQEQKLTASDGVASDEFGSYVTSIAIDSTGTRMVVGAPYATIDGNIEQGASYVFSRADTAWTQEQKVALPNGGAAGDSFGFSVAISGDGMWIVVGAPGTNANQGAVYIFYRSDAAWALEQKVFASDGSGDDDFGGSVAIDGTGVRVIVGAQGFSGGLYQGAAYVFVRSGTAWAQEWELTASDGVPNDEFGIAVAIDSTGTRVAIGAPSAAVTYDYQGAAYIYSRSDTTWRFEQKISADDGAYDENYGNSIAIDGTGTWVVVGVPYATGDINGKGAAYVYSRSDTTWTQKKKLTASDATAGDFLGASVAINDGGTRVIAGATGCNAFQGAAYIFSRDGTAWSQEQKIAAADGATEDVFGRSIAINNTGTSAIVGAFRANIDADPDQGAAYVFSRSGTAWSQEQKITAADGKTNDWFGWSVAIDGTGTRMAAGAYQTTVNDNLAQGAVYVFNFPAEETPTPTPGAGRHESPPTPTPSPISSPSISPTLTPTLTPAPTPTPIPSFSVSPLPPPSITPFPSETPIPTPTPIPTEPEETPSELPLALLPSSEIQPPSAPESPVAPAGGSLLESEPISIPQVVQDIASRIVSIIPGKEQTISAVSGIGITISAVASALSIPAILGSTFDFANYALYLGMAFLEALAIKKRHTPWGTVYDSFTKRPIPFSKLQLLDSSNRVLETRIGDAQGRYGFLIPPTLTTSVQLLVSKPGYAFPSKTVSGSSDTVLYRNLYVGGPISIQGIANFDIPLDPLTPVRAKAIRAPSLTLNAFFFSLVSLGFWASVIAAPLQYLSQPTTLNLIVACILLFLALLRALGFTARKFGVVSNSIGGLTLPFTLITLDTAVGSRSAFTVADEYGRYFLLAQKGTYTFNAHTPANIAPPRTISKPLSTTKGWVAKKIVL